jgi:hypothetical protein
MCSTLGQRVAHNVSCPNTSIFIALFGDGLDQVASAKASADGRQAALSRHRGRQAQA